MKLAVCGKGGIGKTTVSSLLTRALAQDSRVLALDFDVNPGLDMALGDLSSSGQLPAEAVMRRGDADYGWGLREDLTARDAVAAYAAWGPDEIRFLSLGRIESAGHDLSTTHFAVREIARGFDEPGWHTIVDMEAGSKDVYDGGYVDWVDRLLLVTDGSPVGNLTCRRIADIAVAQDAPPCLLAANKARDDGAVAALADELGIRPVGSIPYDEVVRDGDRKGTAVWDVDRDSPACRAAIEMKENLIAQIDGSSE